MLISRIIIIKITFNIGSLTYCPVSVSPKHQQAPLLSLCEPTVLVCALGYFVDIYDLVLFGALRVQSLQSLSVAEENILRVGAQLLNAQMVGMLLGGFLWGIAGDQYGRRTVLFGSILLYSLANLGNAWVESLPAYAVLRFLAGVGLAGELGAAVTLVSEILPRSVRGYGSTLIGFFGFGGAVLATTLASQFSWRISYGLGGILGLLLLLARLNVVESPVYSKRDGTPFWSLLIKPKTLRRFIPAAVVGVPIWFVAGVLTYLAPELGRQLGLTAPVTAAFAILWSYLGSLLGDLLGGVLSQRLKSRKKTIALFLALLAFSVAAYLWGIRGGTPAQFYFTCFFLGVGNGYWALFVLMVSEQFGTNVRATATSVAPNLVRASVIPIVWLFQIVARSLGMLGSAWVLGAGCIAVAAVSLLLLPETFDRDMDFVET
jgi:MFS transporter, putative metabolite:H+ symporter